MKLDLTRYRQPVSQFARTFQPQDVGGETDAYQIVAPVELAFDIQKDKDRFRLVGRVRTELELTCSRCVESYRFPIDAGFDQRYLPATEASTESEREVEEDDLETSYYSDDQIDLSELMREQFYLALPMKPLCREDCKGLCAQCGTNLNTGTCECAPVWEDPRLAALKAILGKTS
jgi:uncharacterized protein